MGLAPYGLFVSPPMPPRVASPLASVVFGDGSMILIGFEGGGAPPFLVAL
ncbi:hypothetical protein A2U01_0093413 [Trifolium medium]|uniref:Uncharacterized protein n=1 Tax=Trifolium medium TaxID=97028 RepID=A0A392UIB7_9FABA|nr:hypothetical protein [Trifolium medium]